MSLTQDILASPTLDPGARKILEDLILRYSVLPAALPRIEVQKLLATSESRLMRLEAAGDLRSFLDGRRRRISTESVLEHQIRQVLIAYPGAAQPVAKRSRPPRLPSANALNALASANEHRHQQARRPHRRKKEAAPV